MNNTRKGMLLVISGPSGVGKGTLISKLMEEDPSFCFSVSATTRGMRVGEVDGVSYHFLTNEEFDRLLSEDAFIEHAEVHGNRYGTLKREVNARLESGQNVLLDIDVQGALQVMKQMPDCVSVFILPPSYSQLRARLEGRQTDAQDVIERRLLNARGEIALLDHYRYAVLNDDLDEAYALLKAIVTAEKQSLSRYQPVIPE